MTIIGNPKTNRVKYEGLVVDFAEYITQNLELAYLFKLINFFL